MKLVFWPSVGKGSEVLNPTNVGKDKEKAWTILQQILGDQTTERRRFYKIGITSCPPRRGPEHGMVELSSREVEDMVYKVYQKGFWSEMHVIYQTTGAEIAEAEKLFIERASNKYGGSLLKAHFPYFLARAEGEPRLSFYSTSGPAAGE